VPIMLGFPAVAEGVVSKVELVGLNVVEETRHEE